VRLLDAKMKTGFVLIPKRDVIFDCGEQLAFGKHRVTKDLHRFDFGTANGTIVLHHENAVRRICSALS